MYKVAYKSMLSTMTSSQMFRYPVLKAVMVWAGSLFDRQAHSIN